MERPVSYFSEGTRVSAVLYLPDGQKSGERVPGVVLCHGFTAIKELILPDYGRRFAAAGIAALAFDYRGFGESDGTRGRLIWRDQVQDIRNSITFLETVPEIDPGRIGLWGTSYGGANVIYTAGIEPRAKCVVAQVGFGDGGRRQREAPPEQTAPMRAIISAERQKRVLTGESTMVDPFTILSEPDSVAFFAEAMKTHARLKTEIPLEFIEATQEYVPEEMAPRIAPRALLVIAAENDATTPADEFRSVYEKAGEPKKLVIIEGIRHYEIYGGEPLERSAREAADWFKRYL
ncbi:MAG: alpha/beta fold hydrolase [Dehalococcoidia bacterium]|nr:lysophospholipase [Dehalococcoidia bacterium]NUQ56568.1 alpha/beta fold hydrolase [Dehalococcoidia bacterium]